jgi:hypothetical protein
LTGISFNPLLERPIAGLFGNELNAIFRAYLKISGILAGGMFFGY